MGVRVGGEPNLDVRVLLLIDDLAFAAAAILDVGLALGLLRVEQFPQVIDPDQVRVRVRVRFRFGARVPQVIDPDQG